MRRNRSRVKRDRSAPTLRLAPLTHSITTRTTLWSTFPFEFLFFFSPPCFKKLLLSYFPFILIKNAAGPFFLLHSYSFLCLTSSKTGVLLFKMCLIKQICSDEPNVFKNGMNAPLSRYSGRGPGVLRHTHWKYRCFSTYRRTAQLFYGRTSEIVSAGVCVWGREYKPPNSSLPRSPRSVEVPQ